MEIPKILKGAFFKKDNKPATDISQKLEHPRISLEEGSYFMISPFTVARDLEGFRIGYSVSVAAKEEGRHVAGSTVINQFDFILSQARELIVTPEGKVVIYAPDILLIDGYRKNTYEPTSPHVRGVCHWGSCGIEDSSSFRRLNPLGVNRAVA
jgi:hypothetical protein